MTVMVIPTRETSQMVMKIGRNGRMFFSVGGVGVPHLSIKTESEGHDRGVTIVEIPTQFITFIHDDPPKSDG